MNKLSFNTQSTRFFSQNIDDIFFQWHSKHPLANNFVKKTHNLLVSPYMSLLANHCQQRSFQAATIEKNKVQKNLHKKKHRSQIFSRSRFFSMISKKSTINSDPRFFCADFFIGTDSSLQYYKNIIAPDLLLKNNWSTVMQLPRIEKIVLNTTSKKYIHDKKWILYTGVALQLLSGQNPLLARVKKSIAQFKIRQHQLVGCKIVLQGGHLWNFLDKLSRILLPYASREWLSREVVQKVQGEGNRKNLGRPGDRSGVIEKSAIKVQEAVQRSPNTGLDIMETPCRKNQGSQGFFLLSRPHRRGQPLHTYNIGLQNVMIFPELENNFECIINFSGLNCNIVFSNISQKNISVCLSAYQIPLKESGKKNN